MFSLEEHRTRWIELIKLYNIFQEDYEREHKHIISLGIDKVCLYQVVTSYYHDVARYKHWHFGPKASQSKIDDAKKSAFIVYWLNKLRPVVIHRVVDDLAPRLTPAAETELRRSLADDGSLTANAAFALYVSNMWMRFQFTDPMAREVLYLLNFRNADTGVLLTLFRMIDDIKKGGRKAVLRI